MLKAEGINGAPRLFLCPISPFAPSSGLWLLFPVEYSLSSICILSASFLAVNVAFKNQNDYENNIEINVNYVLHLTTYLVFFSSSVVFMRDWSLPHTNLLCNSTTCLLIIFMISSDHSPLLLCFLLSPGAFPSTPSDIQKAHKLHQVGVGLGWAWFKILLSRTHTENMKDKIECLPFVWSSWENQWLRSVCIASTWWHFARTMTQREAFPGLGSLIGNFRALQAESHLLKDWEVETQWLEPTAEKAMGESSEGIFYEDILEVPDPLHFLSKIRAGLYLVQTQISTGRR